LHCHTVFSNSVEMFDMVAKAVKSMDFIVITDYNLYEGSTSYFVLCSGYYSDSWQILYWYYLLSPKILAIGKNNRPGLVYCLEYYS